MWRYAKHAMTIMGMSMLLNLPVWAVAGVDVNVNVGIPLPPPIVVAAPPTMVYLAEPGVYVAVGIPYDLFFVGGRYYYYHGDRWFWAPGYRGPWVHVVGRSVPWGLRRYPIERLHVAREREFHRYTVDGSHYHGRHFAGVAGPHEGRRFER